MTDQTQAIADALAPVALATNGKTAKKQVALHELLDATGSVVEDEEDATGARYTLLANKKSVDYQHGKFPDKDRMLAVFGWKTLATNETSQGRNNAKGIPVTPDEQIARIEARMGLLETGKWADRTRDGASINLDAAANAGVDVLVASGKANEADRAALVAERLARLAAEPEYLATAKRAVRGDHAAWAAAYAKRMGRPDISDTDI